MQAAKWIKVNEKLPRDNSFVCTMTKEKVFGLHYYSDKEFLSLMPTFMGDVAYWGENPGDDGNSILIEEPEPMLLN